MRVIVIGGGAMSISVAAELAATGMEVCVVEQDQVGSGTTSTSYGWINANSKVPRCYYELNLAGWPARARAPAKPIRRVVAGGARPSIAAASHDT